MWNHTGFVLLCLAYFIQLNIFEFHPCSSMYQNFIPFLWLSNIPSLYIPHFIHSSVDGRLGCSTFGLLCSNEQVYNYPALNSVRVVFFVKTHFDSVLVFSCL